MLGYKRSSDQGADIVICPRVTDAAVVMGPAAWKYNWNKNDFDKLAGALAAGHIVECGAQQPVAITHFFMKCLVLRILVTQLQK